MEALIYLFPLGALAIVVAGVAVFLTRIYRRVDQGQALIVNTMKRAKVTFHGAFVVPIFHRGEFMDISLKTIEIDRRGKDGLICRDNIRADIKVTFFVRVNQTEEDVLRVAQSVGCARACDQETLEQLFGAKFSEALKTVGKQLDFEDLYKERDAFRDQILKSIGDDLNGYVLEDAAIDFLEQTPVSELDPNNILDAQGIKKITELTAHQRIRTNELQNRATMDIGKNDLDTRVALLDFERTQAEEEAKQNRHIESVKATQQAEAAEIKAQQFARQHLAKLQADEELKLRAIEVERQEELARQDRARVIAVEAENVERERELAAVARERDTELERIAKQRALEQERRAIADVVRERVSMDKTVAQEEERIADLRLLAEAERRKRAAVIAAEGEAEQRVIADVKEAEAERAAAEQRAQQRLIEAQAELEAAAKLAEAQIKRAEGRKAEEAAAGLAAASVKEADAAATEKLGLVEAKVLREQLRAEASGIEAKASAMKQFDAISRDHEEFRLHLEHDRVLSMERIKSSIAIAEAQARALGEAFKAANINVVGGDGAFYEGFVKTVSAGHALEGFMEHSPTAKQLFERISQRLIAEPAAAANDGPSGPPASAEPATVRVLTDGNDDDEPTGSGEAA